MRYILVMLLVASAISTNGQTLTYEYLKLHQNNKKFHCLVNGADTIKMSSQSFTKYLIKGQLYTPQGKYEFKHNLKKKVTEIFNSEGVLVGTSIDNKHKFWTITSTGGITYKHSYDKDGIKYSVSDKEIVKAKIVTDKKAKKKSVEVQIIDASVENIEFIKNLALTERLQYIEEIPKSQARLLGTMAVVTLSVVLTVNANNDSPVK